MIAWKNTLDMKLLLLLYFLVQTNALPYGSGVISDEEKSNDNAVKMVPNLEFLLAYDEFLDRFNKEIIKKIEELKVKSEKDNFFRFLFRQ